MLLELQQGTQSSALLRPQPKALTLSRAVMVLRQKRFCTLADLHTQ
jgi:hypothetical protein